jgi:SPP1 family predicted phage head-tail adaptor
VRTGQLRHTVQIQSVTLTDDGMGSPTESWATVTGGTVRAEIWSLRGEERLAGERLEARVTHRVRMRYFAGLTAAHRLVFGSRTFRIRFVNDVDQRGRQHLLDCEEVA